jgi:alkylation response protein AidB-like acyl-CoA dehydrogenase
MRDRFELAPISPAGRRLAELASRHAPDCAARSERHDREGSFPVESLRALQSDGFLAACVPEELGGLGVESVVDYAVGINRLARGDGATAIAVNMHMISGWLNAYIWRSAVARGQEERAARAESILRLLGSRSVVIASVNSEAGTLPHRPRTEAVRVDGGFRVSGHKIFGTLSPVADLFMSLARVKGEAHGDWMGSAVVPRDSPGVEVVENWDALGMRASGSNDVIYRDCFVPEERFVPVGPWGVLGHGFYEFTLTNHICLSAAFLGVAESARALALDHLQKEQKEPRPGPRAQNPLLHPPVAELEIDLAAARATLERVARAADDHFTEHGFGESPEQDLLDVFREFQTAKLFVQRKAIEIVDRAMTLVGGGAYMARHPLSRLYRDVRAGPFMQPFSPNEALGFIARVTLGLAPDDGL